MRPFKSDTEGWYPMPAVLSCAENRDSFGYKQ